MSDTKRIWEVAATKEDPDLYFVRELPSDWVASNIVGKERAHLIAAAPEMDEALEALLAKLPDSQTIEALKADSGLGHRLYTARYDDAEIVKLFALVAKARGESGGAL